MYQRRRGNLKRLNRRVIKNNVNKKNRVQNKKLNYQNSRRVNTLGSGYASIVIDNEVQLNANQTDSLYQKIDLTTLVFNDNEFTRTESSFKYFKIDKIMLQCLPNNSVGKISWNIADSRNPTMDSDSAKEIFYPFYRTKNFYFRLPNLLYRVTENNSILKPMGWNASNARGELGYIVFRNTTSSAAVIRIRILIRFRGYLLTTSATPTQKIKVEDKTNIPNALILNKNTHVSNIKREIEIEVKTDNESLSINIPKEKILTCLGKAHPLEIRVGKIKDDKPMLDNVTLLLEWKKYADDNDIINPDNVVKEKKVKFVELMKKYYFVDEKDIYKRIDKVLKGEIIEQKKSIQRANAFDLIELAVKNKMLDAIKDWDIIEEAGLKVEIHDVDGEKIVVVDDGKEDDEEEDDEDKMLEAPSTNLLEAYDPNDV